jgi:hypothetical protein
MEHREKEIFIPFELVRAGVVVDLFALVLGIVQNLERKGERGRERERK